MYIFRHTIVVRLARAKLFKEGIVQTRKKEPEHTLQCVFVQKIISGNVII